MRVRQAACRVGPHPAVFGLLAALLGTAGAGGAAAQEAPATRLYGGAEYLLWVLPGARLGVPLVSTGPIETTHHGFLGNADTTILYGAPLPPAQGGSDTQTFPGFSGSRLTLGAWLDQSRRFAVEASGFLLQQRSAGFAISSDRNGLPIIDIPVYNTIPYTPGGRPGGLPPHEDGLPASLPLDPDRFDGNAGVFAGGVTIRNTLQLWGADLTGVAVLYRTPFFALSALAGVRTLGLSEGFGLVYRSVGVSGVYLGESGTAFDSFKTSNQFYGGTLGLRGTLAAGPWSAELTGRVGLGASHEVLSVNGGFSSYGFPNAGATSGPQGIFAQPANEGRFSATRFAVVPEAQIKLGYDATPWLRLTLGYEMLYDSDVIRPGQQIDRNIPKGQTFQQGGTQISATSPARLFRSTDFLAHGLNLGVSIRF